MSFLFTLGGTIFSVEFRAVSNVCHISDRILCRAKGRCCCVCFHFFSYISLLALMFLLFRVEETKGKKENTLFASGKKKKKIKEYHLTLLSLDHVCHTGARYTRRSLTIVNTKNSIEFERLPLQARVNTPLANALTNK